MIEDIAYIPISQELIMTIEKLKGKQETVQDFIKRLIEECPAVGQGRKVCGFSFKVILLRILGTLFKFTKYFVLYM